MRTKLIGVRIEAIERGVIDPGSEPRFDDLSDQFEPASQTEVGICRFFSLLLLIELFELL